MSLVVLAVDPGKTNCGLAVVKFAPGVEDICLRENVDAQMLRQRLKEVAEEYSVDITAIGSGTFSEHALEKAVSAGLPNVQIIDERFSTMEARVRCVESTPTPWYLRIIPKTLRLPKGHCDDWAALILAERAARESGMHW